MAKLKRVSGFPVAEGVRLDVGKYTILAVRNARKGHIAAHAPRARAGSPARSSASPLRAASPRLALDVARFFSGVSESAELDPQRP